MTAEEKSTDAATLAEVITKDRVLVKLSEAIVNDVTKVAEAVFIQELKEVRWAGCRTH